MAPKIFIDGASGTTGLVITELLQPLVKAGAVELLRVDNGHDAAQRRAAYEAADLTVLCLPDDEARAAMVLMEGTKTRVLDASSAHRTEDGWVYGLPELAAEQPAAIHDAKYVSNPGCFATAAVLLLHPLIEAGLLDKKECVTLVGVAGYSAGGKGAIARQEREGDLGDAFAAVSLQSQHKHVAEIQKYAGLETPPVFMPSVVDVPRGMMVMAAFNAASLKGGAESVRKIYEAAYAAAPDVHVDAGAPSRLDFSRFVPLNEKGPTAAPQSEVDIHVSGWQKGDAGQVTVTALIDNLGKGAGAQALQNIKLMLGL